MIITANEIELLTAVARRFCSLPGGGQRPAQWDDVISIAQECYRMGVIAGLRQAATKSGYISVTAEMREHLVLLLENELKTFATLKPPASCLVWVQSASTMVEALLAKARAVRIPGDPRNLEDEDV